MAKFKNSAQRKAVMSKLRKAGFKTNKVDVKGKHLRFRQKSPSRFQKGSFRTIDVGRKGHTKFIVARPKGKSTTEIQSVLVVRGEQ